MLFSVDLKNLPLLARAVIYVLLYLEGVFAGLYNILHSLVRMAWELTWPATRHLWPEFKGWHKEDKEWLPWCAVSYSGYWASKHGPLEVCRRSADQYIITWQGWCIDIFTSALVDRLFYRWVPTEDERHAAKAS